MEKAFSKFSRRDGEAQERKRETAKKRGSTERKERKGGSKKTSRKRTQSRTSSFKNLLPAAEDPLSHKPCYHWSIFSAVSAASHAQLEAQLLAAPTRAYVQHSIRFSGAVNGQRARRSDLELDWT